MREPYRHSVDEVLDDQRTDPAGGLSEHEAQRRRHAHGPNQLRRLHVRATGRILLDQLTSVVVLLLLAAATAAALLGRPVEALAIAAAVLVNTGIGFVMELRATRAMEALRRLGKVQARVRRDGRVRELAADTLVPGDIVLLEAGDMVAADLRLIEANSLQCDESALTGESVPVIKQTAAIAQERTVLGDRHNMAHKGTAVTQGSGCGVVVATGMATELGHISALVESAGESVTPLERRLDRLGTRLIWLTIAIAALVSLVGFLAGQDLLLMLETAIALAIAAVPEGLPVVATLALAQGMRRMARRDAVVKRLSAVETLGAANLIFCDKTGTLTENHMQVACIRLADTEWNRDRATAPAGVKAALRIGVLCNNASLDGDNSVGDPTEIALLEGARDEGLVQAELQQAYPEVREIGFDPGRRMMATVHEQQEPGYRVAVKGAPEAVLACCTHVLDDGNCLPLDAAGKEQWQGHASELAGRGLRVLALAEKTEATPEADPYHELNLVALVGLYDPPRAGIETAMQACRDAGIRVIMGTGDHAATARAIAEQIGLAETGQPVVEASQLPDLGRLDDAQRETLLKTPVFARISPEQKLQLVGLYQASGHVVGMTGDGVNDAPALRKADIGIAMGKRGTDVAREAADMVLKDDAFASILVAIEQGRALFTNIRRFIVYLLSGNLAEILAVSVAALLAAPLPLLPLQILYINFVSDVLPALALGLSRSEEGVMQQSPRATDEPVLTSVHWLTILAYSLLIASAVLGAFACALLWLEMDEAMAVTIGFLTFGFARLWHVFNMRSRHSGLWRNAISRNRYIWLALGLGVVLLLAAIHVPLLASLLSVVAPTGAAWVLILGFSALPLVIGQLGLLVARRWSR